MLSPKDRLYSVLFIIVGFLLLGSIILFAYSIVVTSGLNNPSAKVEPLNTFTSAKYWFSYQYPQWYMITGGVGSGQQSYPYYGLTYQIPGSGSNSASNTFTKFRVGVYPRTGNESALEAYRRIHPVEMEKIKRKPFIVDGIEGEKITGIPDTISYLDPTSVSNKVVLVAKGTVVYELRQGEDLTDVDFNALISTFKFTDSVASWTTYVNKEAGYSFQYPSDKWKVIPTTSGVNIVPIEECQWYVCSSGFSIDKYDPNSYEPGSAFNSDPFTIGKKETSLLDGQKVTVYKSSDLRLVDRHPTTIIFKSGNNQYVISRTTDLEPTIDLILSSFHFINQQLTSEKPDWQIYANPQYPYSFSYPKDWRVKIVDKENQILSIGPISNDQATGAGLPTMTIMPASIVEREDRFNTRKTVSINGYDFVYQREQPFDVVDSYYIPYANRYFVLQWNIEFTKEIPIYKNILESFKLI